jgi:hypothetical protein
MPASLNVPILEHYRPRAAAVFGANEITAAACSLVREADDGAGVRSIEIRQKPFRVGRMNHNVPIAMKDNGQRSTLRLRNDFLVKRYAAEDVPSCRHRTNWARLHRAI